MKGDVRRLGLGLLVTITRTYTVKRGIITMRGNSSVVEHIDITDEVPGSNPGYFSSN